ncbi:cupin domain-containing protein [Xanthobacter wiegelii]|uniref:cupin domain-containing protein n=1 Tax=Xanthobacter wiegelii TaxID=3119913 RepID=UPI003734C357
MHPHPQGTRRPSPRRLRSQPLREGSFREGARGTRRDWFGAPLRDLGIVPELDTHPLGQTLYVMSGEGWFQLDGESAREIRPGDTIWIAPGEKHWHGASAHSAMRHLAIQEALDGKHITWLEPVSDEQYPSHAPT